ncbi:MAG: glycosyltransferase family 4 protein [Anaerolineae bacterium]|nr:glycosyltransferase family 4 protein [Anaerolineae bacterium]
MRVLFLTGEFPPMQGGVGDCTHEIARGLITLGAEVSVLTSIRVDSDQQSAVSGQQSAVGGRRSAVSDQGSGVSVLPIIRYWGWFSLRCIANVIREFAPHIVHIQYQTGAFAMHPAINFAPRLLKSRATRFITTFHDLRVPYLFPKAGRVRTWVTHELARASDAVIATNDEDYAQLETLNLQLLTLIPIGSNITTTPPPDYDRAAWRAQLGVRDDETLLCYFGFLNESKGGETLIRALALVPNAKLLMIGGQIGASDPTNVAYLARVQSLISNLHLTNRVLWTDYTPPEIVSANFYASDVCVLPYRDGASYRRGTLMAALAHGMAIVTTKPAVSGQPSAVSRQPSAISGQRSAISGQTSSVIGHPSSVRLPQLRDGENCLLVPPDDPRALADAIQRAMASAELRAKIGAGARALAQHFTWDKIAQQHLELYERAIK